jgi:hypothetical protein
MISQYFTQTIVSLLVCGRQAKRDSASDALPFGRLWYGEPDAIRNAVGYAKFRSRSHDAVIRVYDDAGNVVMQLRDLVG